MTKAERVAATAAVLALAAGGCSNEPKRIDFDKALTSCVAFTPVLILVGMPEPSLQPEPNRSRLSTSINCAFSDHPDGKSPGVFTAIINVYRPISDSHEKDPVKRFGGGFVAKDFCSGVGADNPALPVSSVCYLAFSPQILEITVTSFTKQSAIRITLNLLDAGSLSEKVRSDALDKANMVVQSVIEMI